MMRWTRSSGHHRDEGELDCRRRYPVLFDSVDHEWLIRFVEHRVGDQRVIRLIRKWLTAGVMEDGTVTASDTGTPQGAVVSCLLSNLYLHHVFDLWVQWWRKHHAHGNVVIVRYADDLAVGCEHKATAERFLADLHARLDGSLCRYIRRRRVSSSSAVTRSTIVLSSRPRFETAETFNFLGFTHIAPDPVEAHSSSSGSHVAIG